MEDISMEKRKMTKGRLVSHQEQEQDAVNFRGVKQEFHFKCLPVYMTKGFFDVFGPLSGAIINDSLALINQISSEKERVQVFVYGCKEYWAISNWEVGTEKSDYVSPEELNITFLLPSEY